MTHEDSLQAISSLQEETFGADSPEGYWAHWSLLALYYRMAGFARASLAFAERAHRYRGVALGDR